MRILYGVQATGNGHITRARVMSEALAAEGLDVDYLFSGRAADQFFDMEPFADFEVRRGLTFAMGAEGRVDKLKTVLANNIPCFIREVRQLDLSGYDLVLTDFEPVSAWAARLQGVPSIGIAHQYAFCHQLYGRHANWKLKAGVNLFAPVQQALGVHWYDFDQPILPPLIQPPTFPATTEADKILVYLPHEESSQLVEWFRQFPDYRFVVYCKLSRPEVVGNVFFQPFGRETFERDLASSNGVIANCGFGLASETMQYGKKLLSQPYHGQTEQLSNGEILAHLKLATITRRLSPEIIADWLEKPSPNAVCWPDVAGAIASWLAAGRPCSVTELAQSIWQERALPVLDTIQTGGT